MFNRFVLFLTSLLIAVILLMTLYRATQATTYPDPRLPESPTGQSLQPLVLSNPPASPARSQPGIAPTPIQPTSAAQKIPIAGLPTPTAFAQPASTTGGQPRTEPNNSRLIVPSFINHRQPEFSTSEGAFTLGGCAPGSLTCPPESLIGMLGCQRVVARDLVGGLTPAIPAGWCIIEQGLPFDELLFHYVPGLQPYYRSYILYQDSMYRLVGDPSVLRSLYAPIKSPDEALSYALLLSDYQPVYNLGYNPNAQYQTYIVEDTYVETSLVGYEVHLFTTQWLPGACATATTYAIDLLVAWDGTITILNMQAQWIEMYCL